MAFTRQRRGSHKSFTNFADGLMELRRLGKSKTVDVHVKKNILFLKSAPL